ncbi:Type IV secretion system protein VirB6 [Candidatus Cyrtobacter comes]|uniref:Type IV secretion system protein VirB6 n=1 Tax=Candidatus Cyrtobacter comes TaxID=675776 RepID=A0ABU5L7Q4_9RICK|nr:type IV secretion system protein [Candidatus Cyrtobacter comes]MDZ5761930.1 Type IV secretion system protein VirB6 [Candidatus Cyrtobacter comes]
MRLKILFFIFQVVICSSAQADFYSDCVKSYEFNDNIKNEVFLTPVKYSCSRMCRNECNSFSRKVGPEGSEHELNQSIIDDCITSCQDGRKFDAEYFEITGYNERFGVKYPIISLVGPISTKVACSQDKKEIGDSVVKTSIEAEIGDKIKFFFIGYEDNKIYLCGKKAIELRTVFPNLSSKNFKLGNSLWNNIATPPAEWQKHEHECFSQIPQQSWLDLSNRVLSQAVGQSKCEWHARNHTFTYTGINPKNGDELNISWSGDFAYKKTATGKAKGREEYMTCITSLMGIGAQSCRNEFINSTSLLIMDPKYVNKSSTNVQKNNTQNTPNTADVFKILSSMGQLPHFYNKNATELNNIAIKFLQSIGYPANLFHSFRHGIKKNEADGGASPYHVESTISIKSSNIKDLEKQHWYYCDMHAKGFEYCMYKWNIQNIIGKDVDTTAVIQLSGEQSRKNWEEIGLLGARLESSNHSVLGLKGSITDQEMTFKFRDNIPGCNQQDESSYKKRLCVVVDKIGRSTYRYSGILSGFSDKSTPLFIKHWGDHTDGSILRDVYENNDGGYDVSIEWGGCIKRKGENMQYAFGPISYDSAKIDPNTSSAWEWKDFPKSVLDGKNMEVTKAGALYLRIKKEEPPQSASSDIKELYQNPANHHGLYKMIVEMEHGNSAAVQGGILSKLAKLIIDHLLGENRAKGEIPKGGVLFKIYKGVTENKSYQQSINVLISLFITITALCFLIGIIQISHQEVIMMLCKMAAIACLISPYSWEFFGGRLAVIFIEGTLELMAKFAPPDLIEIDHDAFSMFRYMDGAIMKIFSAAIWKKMAALIFSTAFGIIAFVVIFISICLYILGILRIFLAYVVSLVTTSLCVIIAPIIIPTVLFKQSRSIFDSWIKGMISVVLQCSAVFITLSMFQVIMSFLLSIVLGFTACKACLLRIDIGIFNECIIPMYKMLGDMHTPPDSDTVGTSPLMSSFGIAIAFFVIASSLVALIQFMDLVMTVIVTGSPIRTSTISAPAQQGEKFLSNTISAATSEITGLGKVIASKISSKKSEESSTKKR